MKTIITWLYHSFRLFTILITFNTWIGYNGINIIYINTKQDKGYENEKKTDFHCNGGCYGGRKYSGGRRTAWWFRQSVSPFPEPHGSAAMWSTHTPTAFRKRFSALKADWKIESWNPQTYQRGRNLSEWKFLYSPGDNVSHGIRWGLVCLQSLSRSGIHCGNTDHRSLTSFFRSLVVNFTWRGPFLTPFCYLLSLLDTN